MSPEKPDALLWMDVETTGLDANKCSILEIGLRCTTLDAMREHALLEAVVHISRETMLSAQLPALDLHLNNGLLAQCETSDPVHCSPEAIARKTVRFIKDMSGMYTLHPAGTNIQRFDLPIILRFCATAERIDDLLSYRALRPDRTAPHSQDARPRPLHAQGQAHAPRPRLPGQGHHGIPALPHPHDGAGARSRQRHENQGRIMSIISKEACFRYPERTVDDVHDTLAQVYTSDDLQEAYMFGAQREPTGLEVEAAAEQLYYSDCNSSGLLLDSDWNRLPEGNKAIYRNRVRAIITTIQKKGTAE